MTAAADLELTPAPGVITVFADIWCSFAHIAIYRMHATRERLGIHGVQFDIRAFPLELLNDAPSPRAGTDSEVGRMGQQEPAAGWQLWQEKEYLYPSTTLPALEAVIAAKEQGLHASEQLDLMLRKAFWAQSRCISNRRVIMDAAESAGVVDTAALAEALDDGRARKALSQDAAISATDRVVCSPHLFLPDGTDVANPGIEVHWEGDYGVGWPVVGRDDPSVFENLIKRALA
jgi:predicted DsbA family dithiol-disulfide isomerase